MENDEPKRSPYRQKIWDDLMASKGKPDPEIRDHRIERIINRGRNMVPGVVYNIGPGGTFPIGEMAEEPKRNPVPPQHRPSDEAMRKLKEQGLSYPVVSSENFHPMSVHAADAQPLDILARLDRIEKLLGIK